MADIEDVVLESNEIERSEDKSINKSLVFQKSTQRNSKHGSDVDEFTQTAIPGVQKIWLKTYGCSHNVSDSEYMEGILSSYGFRITPNENEADLWLINSCTVKDPSQSAFIHLVNKAKSEGRPVVVAGCVSQADRNLKGLEEVSVVGISQIDRVVEVVEQTLQGNIVRLLGKKSLPKLDLPKIRKNPLVEIIPLSTGCLGACTYCKTKHARGKLGSYALEAIVSRVQRVISEGVTEIWLSSEDTGAYGRDIGTSIVELLRAIIAVLPPPPEELITHLNAMSVQYPDDQQQQQPSEPPSPSSSSTSPSSQPVMLRVGMTNPPYILEHLEGISEVLNHPCVFSFLHVPVQSGSNPVLDAMNREYTVEEFKQVADVLLSRVPNMTLATDIICGFPGETEEDFSQTLSLISHYQLPVVNISQFYPRPGTPAASMTRLPTDKVKARSRELTKLFESYQPYAHLLHTHQPVWFDTEISSDGRHSVGHTKSYVKVLVPLDLSLPGNCCLVRVKHTAKFHVEGEIIKLIQSYTGMALGGGGGGGVSGGGEKMRSEKKKQLSFSPSTKSTSSSLTSSSSCSVGGGGGCGEGSCDCEGQVGKKQQQTTSSCSSNCCEEGGCGKNATLKEGKNFEAICTMVYTTVAFVLVAFLK